MRRVAAAGAGPESARAHPVEVVRIQRVEPQFVYSRLELVQEEHLGQPEGVVIAACRIVRNRQAAVDRVLALDAPE